MTRSPFYFSRVGTLIFKMNRASKARPVSKSSLHLDIHDAPADHFCKMPIKKFTAVEATSRFAFDLDHP